MFKGCKEGHLLGLFSFFRAWFFSPLSVRRLPSFFPLNHRHSYHHLRLQAHPPLFSSFSPPLLVAFPDQASHRPVTAVEAWSRAAAAASSLLQSSLAIAEGRWTCRQLHSSSGRPCSCFSLSAGSHLYLCWPKNTAPPQVRPSLIILLQVASKVIMSNYLKNLTDLMINWWFRLSFFLLS